MDLSTKYMGLDLKSPIIVGSSNLTSSVNKIKDCASAGAGAVVLKSLFEEQIVTSPDKLVGQSEMYFWYPEAIEEVNKFSKEQGVNQYLELIKEAKAAVDIPVIASINCVSPKEWPAFASKIEEAGADGIELNIFIPPTNINMAPEQIEKTYSDIILAVKEHTKLPVSAKLGSYFTNLTRTMVNLGKNCADGLVLFNRYFRPDIDIEKMNIIASNVYSAPEEITHSLRWIALLSGKVECDLAASTGIHDGKAVIKEILAGASAVQVATALYKNGTGYIKDMLQEVEGWMASHNYATISDFKGLICQDEQNSAAFERVQFMKKTSGQYT